MNTALTGCILIVMLLLSAFISLTVLFMASTEQSMDDGQIQGGHGHYMGHRPSAHDPFNQKNRSRGGGHRQRVPANDHILVATKSTNLFHEPRAATSHVRRVAMISPRDPNGRFVGVGHEGANTLL